VPRKLVARLKIRKVRAVVPEAPHASAHRVASKTDDVSSPRVKRVMFSVRLRIKILLSGVFGTKDGRKGRFSELL
jgi:hypothetical protein